MILSLPYLAPFFFFFPFFHSSSYFFLLRIYLNAQKNKRTGHCGVLYKQSHVVYSPPLLTDTAPSKTQQLQHHSLAGLNIKV